MNRLVFLAAVSLIPLSPSWAEAPMVDSLAPGTGIVIFDDRTFELKAFPGCAVGPNGGYNFWLVTPDEEDPNLAKQGAPRLQATSDGKVTSLVFYPGGDSGQFSMIGTGDDFVPFDGDMFHYSGPIGENGGRQIEIHVKC